MAERILCVLGKLRAGGVESIMFSYYRFLDKNKYQYDFLYEEGSTFDVPEEILALGARSYKIPSVGSPIAYVAAIRKIIKENKYKTVHTNMNTLSVFSLFAAWSCGVKYRILHNHSTSSGVEKKRDIIKKILRPFNVMLTNKPCACSELAARWMYGDKAVDADRVQVFRNGVDTEKFAFSSEYREVIRKEFNIENKRVIGHVGRFMTQKNHFFLIDLFERYAKDDDSAVLMLVGDGELKADVMRYVADRSLSDKVIFTGVRMDVYKLFSAFDVFVLPSLYEGLPVVGMEACAAGLPLLLADTITRECAISDYVEFLPIDNVDRWSDSIRRSLNVDRETIARTMVGGPFDIRECVKVLENYYSTCT